MTMDDFIFVGFNSQVAALNRDSGELMWSWKAPEGSGFVAVLIDGDRIIASVQGYTYCLDPMTGEELWRNPLKGMGVGTPCVASVRGGSLAGGLFASAAADILQQQEQQAAASSSAAT
jgi:outer membrane protein assembly factor BamB